MSSAHEIVSATLHSVGCGDAANRLQETVPRRAAKCCDTIMLSKAASRRKTNKHCDSPLRETKAQECACEGI